MGCINSKEIYEDDAHSREPGRTVQVEKRSQTINDKPMEVVIPQAPISRDVGNGSPKHEVDSEPFTPKTVQSMESSTHISHTEVIPEVHSIEVTSEIKSDAAEVDSPVVVKLDLNYVSTHPTIVSYLEKGIDVSKINSLFGIVDKDQDGILSSAEFAELVDLVALVPVRRKREVPTTVSATNSPQANINAEIMKAKKLSPKLEPKLNSAAHSRPAGNDPKKLSI